MPRAAAGIRHLVRDFGTCLNFAGGAATDRVAFAHSTSLIVTDNFTITAWAFPRGLGASNAGRILAKTSSVNGNGYALLFGASNTLRTFINNTSQTSSVSRSFKLNEWSHFAVTFEKNAGSNQLKFYVNGAAAGVATWAASVVDSAEELRIGNADQLNRAMDGRIDETKVYNRTLSPTEIENEYRGYNTSTSGLVLHTKFDEGSGTAAVDSSGTQADGTITGATYSTDVRFKPRTASTGRFPKTPQIQDPFTRADSALTLGTTTVGGLAWSAVTGVMGISSNTAYYVSGGNNTFWTVDAGTPNVIASVTMSTYGGGAKEQGLYFRVVDANNFWRMLRSNNSLLLQRRVAGSTTTMNTTSPAMADGDVYKIRAYNNNIQMLLNDRLVYSVDDTSLNTATKHGIGVGTANTGSRWDNFSIAKLI